MAYFSPEESFEVLKQRTADTVKEHFPVQGTKNTLVAKKVWVEDKKHIDDIEDQLDARLKGRSWAVPVKAQVELRDNKTGKVKDRKTVTVAQLPKITNRYSYIVDGNEWQVNNQFRLKSGVYTRVKDNGELTSQWNLAKGRGFSMDFDPASKKMTMGYGTSNIPLYPVLKTMGVADDDIERQWGREVLDANKKMDQGKALMQLHKVMTGKAATNLDEAKNEIAKTFGETQLRPDSTKITLGKPFGKVDGGSLLAGSDKLLKVARQEAEPDDRDSLEFKELWSSEDLIQERLSKDARVDIDRRIRNNVDRKRKVAEIVGPDTFGKPLKQFFTNSSLSERPDQRNPIGFLVGARKTTVMGKHGIEEERKITLDAQSINPSHMGFLDPVHTPESKTIGVTLQMASGAKKVGKDLRIPVINAKTGRKELIDPATARNSNVAFYDQYKWQSGKPPAPKGAMLKVSNEKGDISSVAPKDVKYILPSTKGMFDVSTNMIPFLQSNQGNRTMVAARQAEQAVPLIHREAPLVQVKTEAGTTFEGIVGKLSSHRARVNGEVTRVGKDGITIKDERGKSHKIPLYNDFPLNDNKSVISSTPLVQKGDRVKAGQTVADSSFTKNGTLSMGSNLRVAYMPYKGLNFEDGVVISESASKKMTSEHMHRHGLQSDANTTLNKKKFLAETAGQITSKQADKLDDDAVVRPGQMVESGDVLIGALKKETLTPEQKQLALFSRKAAKPVRPNPTVWDKDYPGVVSRVVKHGKNTTVYVKTATPAEVGDKMVGRHGNKGIITAILPDSEMPKTKDGKSTEVLLNPAGVPGRINLGQIMETAAAKIAEKTGKPYAVNNFDPNNSNYSVNLQKEMKAHGVSDTEELFDPQTDKSYGKVLTGPQYIYKLHHTVDKKRSARSRGAYTLNRTPQRGGPTGGQSMDIAGEYALLAHGARESVRESQTLRSDMNDEMWSRIQEGGAVPAPRTPFVYKKFESMLRGAGIDVKKDGNVLQLEPMTDKKVLQLSNGEIKDPGRVLRAKDAQPETGGLFDPVVTGTAGIHKMGDKWAHIKLAERVPNPTFEKPVRSLLGLNEREFSEVMAGKREINGKTSAKAIVDGVSKVDVDKELADLKKRAPNLKGSDLNAANLKMKYLRGLKQAGMTPKEAYTMQYVPVLPPTMRPIAVQPTGDLNEADLNGLYSRGIGAPNHQLKTFDKALPPEEKHELVEALYDGVKATQLTGMAHKNRYRSGIVEQISGARRGSPKEGFFQKQVIGRRQDLSMRSTIVPDPSLNLDEVAIPQKAAAEMYKPFVVSRMRRMGFTPLEAQKAIKENSPTAVQALKAEAAERPVLLKRDPVLHKYGVQAFKPRLVEGKTIKIHPLVTSGYNADFDGDQMSAFVPISPKAVREAHGMFPSNNLFSSSHGDIMYKPGHEAILGLYKMTEMGKQKNVVFDSPAEAARAVKEGKISMTDVVSIKNLGGPMEKVAAPQKATKTTVGRLLVYNSLPKEVRDEKMLTDKKFVLGKKESSAILTQTGKVATAKYAATADKLKDLGNSYATGMSMSLKDFTAETADRDAIFKVAKSEEARIRKNPRLTPEQQDKAVTDMYSKASQEIEKRAKAKIERSGNKMYDWVKSGSRGEWAQFKQMNVAPLLVVDSRGKTVPVPIDRSYSEGLDAAGYWTSMHGARMGTISRVQGTELPGALMKQLIRTSVDQVVVSDDCKTSRGIAFNVDDPNALDRYTAKPIDLGTRGGKTKGKIPSGTLVTPELLNRLKNNKVKEVPVRTPLKCSHGSGVCAKCMGLSETGQKFEKGTNVGIRAAQALGEPATQMSMNAFHTGGVAGGAGSDAVSQFTRLKQLTEVPKTLPGAATLSTEAGKVEHIEKDPGGGWSVYVGGQRHFVPGRRQLAVAQGQAVRRGDSLSTGPKNPHDMLPLTGLGSVQRYMTDEIQKLYPNKSPLHRRNTEVVVRAMTNLSVVNDPGSDPEVLVGDRMPTSKINAFNSHLGAGKRPIQHTPVLKGTNVLPNELHEDWLARMQNDRVKDTLLQGVAKGWKSDLHGTHPIPGMAYGSEFGIGTDKEPWLY